MGQGGYHRYRVKQAANVAPILTKVRHFDGQDLSANPLVALTHSVHSPAKKANPSVAETSIESWLMDYCMRRNTDAVLARDVLRFGPARVRDKNSLDAALVTLVAAGRVTLVRDGRKNVIKLNFAVMTANVA